MLINQSSLRRHRPIGVRALGIALLALCASFLIANPSRADAGEYRYCYGTVLKGKAHGGKDSVCEPALSYNAAWATGAQHSICLQPWFHHEKTKCTSGPGDSVYIEASSETTGAEPFAILNNAEGENTVYGVGFTNGGGGGGGSQPPPPPVWHTDNLGGNISSDPDIASYTPGHLDVFAKSTTNALTHRWWDNSTGWSSWENLGGSMSSGPGVVSSGFGRLDVVYREANGTILDRWWNTNTGWHSENLGGTITGDPDIASWGGGHLDIFGRNASNNHLMHKWYDSSQGWSGWEDLGGSLTSGPAAVSWGFGRLDVVAGATDHSVTHWFYDGSGWHVDNLGGYITADPDISSWGSGRLDVFSRGGDNALWHKWFAGGGWLGWESLGGTLTSGPGAVSWSNGRIDVVGRTTSNSVQHWYWQQ